MIPEELDTIIYDINKALENFGNDLKQLKKHIKKNRKIRNNSYGIS